MPREEGRADASAEGSLGHQRDRSTGVDRAVVNEREQGGERRLELDDTEGRIDEAARESPGANLVAGLGDDR